MIREKERGGAFGDEAQKDNFAMFAHEKKKNGHECRRV